MHIHIVGIAGTMTAPLAAELKRLKHLVTGSDQNKIYPPVSTILSKSKIKVNSFQINNKVNLAIIGSSYKAFSNTQAEYTQIKKLKIPYISATRYIAKNVGKEESILIAGSAGKTTITSLVTWIFQTAKLDPSYMFAGESLNKIPPIRISDSKYSILEADESINGLDTKAKFLYYPARYLLLTAASWEHKDSYKTESDNFNAFANLVKRIPKNGLLVCNPALENISKLTPLAKCKIITYGSPETDYQLTDVSYHNNRSLLVIKIKNKTIKIKTRLIGQYNFQNIVAAVALSHQLGIDLKTISKAIAAYKGVRRRLELVADTQGILFYDDFAQAPSRVASVIQTLRHTYPNRIIKVFFEPHASFLANKQSLKGFKDAFDCADKVILSKIPFKPDIDRDHRVTAADYRLEVGEKLTYIPLLDEVYSHFSANLSPGDILVHFSSGGLDGLKTFRQIINYFKKLCPVTS